MIETENKDKVPTFFKKVGNITYRVKVYFNEKSKENMQQKIERMLRDEIRSKKDSKR